MLAFFPSRPGQMRQQLLHPAFLKLASKSHRRHQTGAKLCRNSPDPFKSHAHSARMVSKMVSQARKLAQCGKYIVWNKTECAGQFGFCHKCAKQTISFPVEKTI